MKSDSKDMFLSEVQPGIRRPMSTGPRLKSPSLPLGKVLLKLIIIPEKCIFGTKSVEIVLPMVVF
jgi:hypothetical protein